MRIAKHGIAQVGRSKLNGRGESPAKRAGDDTGAAGQFEDARASRELEPFGKVIGIGLEEDGTEVLVVSRRDGAGKDCVLIRHTAE